MKKFTTLFIVLLVFACAISKAQQTDTVHVSSFDSIFAPLVQHSASGFIIDPIEENIHIEH